MNCDLTRRFQVTFIKDFGAFKAGDTTQMTFPIATMMVKKGVAEATQELIDYGKSVGVKFRRKNVDK